MRETVTVSDKQNDTFVLDSLESLGDARAAWEAVQYCIRREIAFPQWVLDYLAETGSRLDYYLDNRDERSPTSLIYALGFDKLHTLEAYDRDHDPEVIFETINTWIMDGDVKNPTEGARRYHAERWNGAGDPESVRKAFYKGKERWKHPDPWNPKLSEPRR